MTGTSNKTKAAKNKAAMVGVEIDSFIANMQSSKSGSESEDDGNKPAPNKSMKFSMQAVKKSDMGGRDRLKVHQLRKFAKQG